MSNLKPLCVESVCLSFQRNQIRPRPFSNFEFLGAQNQTVSAFFQLHNLRPLWNSGRDPVHYNEMWGASSESGSNAVRCGGGEDQLAIYVHRVRCCQGDQGWSGRWWYPEPSVDKKAQFHVLRRHEKEEQEQEIFRSGWIRRKSRVLNLVRFLGDFHDSLMGR